MLHYTVHTHVCLYQSSIRRMHTEGMHKELTHNYTRKVLERTQSHPFELSWRPKKPLTKKSSLNRTQGANSSLHTWGQTLAFEHALHFSPTTLNPTYMPTPEKGFGSGARNTTSVVVVKSAELAVLEKVHHLGRSRLCSQLRSVQPEKTLPLIEITIQDHQEPIRNHDKLYQ